MAMTRDIKHFCHIDVFSNLLRSLIHMSHVTMHIIVSLYGD